MGWLRKRFGESSTYTGLALLAAVAGHLAGPEALAGVSPIVAALVGLYDAMRAEKQ